MTSHAQIHPADEYYFPPDSAIWRINRERALLLTGTRVLLMQIAHPMVAEAVYHHSYVFQKPLLRLHRTLALTLALVYGTRSEINQAIAEIDAAHRPAVGHLEDAIGAHQAGAAYNPRNPRQARWIFATLVEGAIFGHEKLVAPLSTEDQQAFYEDSMHVGEWMGVPQRLLPATYDGLLDLMQEAIDSQEVIVGEKARTIAPFLTAQSIPLLQFVAYPAYRLAVGLLPPEIRVQYGYTFRGWEGRLLRGFCGISRTVVPWLPGVVRYAPEYRRAQNRLHNA
jgi:uncharacterized protein (DUF2236 family)